VSAETEVKEEGALTYYSLGTLCRSVNNLMDVKMKDDTALMQLMEALSDDGEEANGVNPALLPDELRQRFKRMNEPRDFEVGDLVVWKDGLKNKKFPRYGEPVIVTKLLDEPILDATENPGSSYFRGPLDMVFMRIASDGDAMEWYVDSRRFRKMTPEEEEKLTAELH